MMQLNKTRFRFIFNTVGEKSEYDMYTYVYKYMYINIYIYLFLIKTTQSLFDFS